VCGIVAVLLSRAASEANRPRPTDERIGAWRVRSSDACCWAFRYASCSEPVSFSFTAPFTGSRPVRSWLPCALIISLSLRLRAERHHANEERFSGAAGGEQIPRAVIAGVAVGTPVRVVVEPAFGFLAALAAGLVAGSRW
jgi:hypothetical protein